MMNRRRIRRGSLVRKGTRRRRRRWRRGRRRCVRVVNMMVGCRVGSVRGRVKYVL